MLAFSPQVGSAYTSFYVLQLLGYSSCSLLEKIDFEGTGRLIVALINQILDVDHIDLQ